MLYASEGDPVWLPQGTILYTCKEGHDTVFSGTRIRYLDDPQRGILLEKHPAKYNMRKVYLSSGTWWVDESEIKYLVGDKIVD